MQQSDRSQDRIYGIDARTGEKIEPGYPPASADYVAQLCCAADAAFDGYRDTGLEHRASFLERVADEIIEIGEPLVEIAVRETGLSAGRIQGERERTAGQLRLFGEVVRKGDWIGARIDTALPDREPVPRPDLRLRRIPVGPVAVFGASNFPLAFSVAGGDTASALAAGCPVVVKAHPSHPGTSQLVADAIERAVEACGMPAGTFGMFQTAENAVSGSLVADPHIKAVGFTGSRSGGRALMAIAAGREEPIPVFAEMSSINPVIVLPAALSSRGERIATDYAASLTLGAGQFCTNPGLMILLRGAEVNDFLGTMADKIAAVPAATMLSPNIHAAHSAGVATLDEDPDVNLLARGLPAIGAFDAAASVFLTSADRFRANEKLSAEVFGPTGLIVECDTIDEVRALISDLEGQLTIAVHMDENDHATAAELLPLLEKKAGRILANGYGTGVEVSHAMVHGGPFPATSDSRTTSVGTLAIDRFLRPVCYQDIPVKILPAALRDDNPDHIPRLVDGNWQRA